MIKKMKSKKGFTIIELIVVIAIIAILALIATPRFKGVVDSAKITQIQNDVKVLETQVQQDITLHDKSPSDWGTNFINDVELNKMIANENLYNKKGLLKSENAPSGGNYYIVPESEKQSIKTKLKGEFLSNNQGDVYYNKNNIEGTPQYSEKEIDDFIEEHDDTIPVASYEDLMAIGSGGKHTFAKGTKWEAERTTHISDSRFYIQVKNIDLEGKEFNPIGSSDWAFRGSYNGGSYTISNMSIIQPDKPFAGMFGKVHDSIMMDINLKNVNINSSYSAGALIGYVHDKDVGTEISNVHITGKIESGDNTGGIVGYASTASIKNSSVDVEINTNGKVSNFGRIGGVTGSNSSRGGLIENVTVKANIKASNENDNIGGLIGNNYGKIYNSSVELNLEGGNSNIGGLVGKNHGEISNSHSSGAVSGNKNVGGLVGSTGITSIIKQSYSSVNVESTGSNTGGLVGNNLGKILNTYSLGDVKGNGDVGGLVGDNEGEIVNSYAVGVVKSIDANAIGGVIGKQNTGSVLTSNSYYDIENSALDRGGSPNGGVEGKTTVEMKKKSTYKNWDFNKVWRIQENKDYPTLR